eukprot:6454903-Amphidinium_carterae.1
MYTNPIRKRTCKTRSGEQNPITGNNLTDEDVNESQSIVSCQTCADLLISSSWISQVCSLPRVEVRVFAGNLFATVGALRVCDTIEELQELQLLHEEQSRAAAGLAQVSATHLAFCLDSSRLTQLCIVPKPTRARNSTGQVDNPTRGTS